MNRIILIGNGFDLAHGLPTSYKNFIDWYWNKCKTELISCQYNTIKDDLCEFSVHENKTWISYLYGKISVINPPTGRELVEYLKNNPETIVNTCDFMNIITKSVETKGWVDIENEYYKLLVQSLDKNNTRLNHHDLNNQLKCLQNYLVEYLKLLSFESINLKQNIKDIIYSPINPQDISVKEKEQIISHINYWINCDEYEFYYKMEKYNLKGLKGDDQKDYKMLKEKLDMNNMIRRYPSFFLPNNIMFLNFNYTNTLNRYVQANNPSFEINHIHGELSNPDSVIFGYGDELDENYKNLSNLNDNEYLKNFKSIKYLESDRYRKALQFMDAEPYQVFILGHSCGNSDRTLLNTLFEHKNCVSIKPYYYKFGEINNYLDIVQNISRNFTDMKLMRDRVVNKTYCEPFSES